MRADRDLARVEPAFETIGVDAEPIRTSSARRVRGKRSPRSSLLGERHLAASKPHDWAAVLCRVRRAWALPGKPTGKGVRIAHPDTGYTGHPELDAHALRPSYNFV